VNFWVPGGNGLFARLKAFGPDVVLLTAYRGLYHLAALRAAHQLGARIIMRHEASDVAEARSFLKERARDWLLRRLYARVDRFAVIGLEARRHLVRIGVPIARVGWAPYCVDSDFMARQTDLWLPQRDRLRVDLGVQPGDTVLVFSGKLTPKKNPLLITAALAALSPVEREKVHLVVAGDGELRGELEQSARPLLGARLHLLGFLNQSQIGQAYAAGDALILPSVRGAGETWGLVVNEAMQFRLPAIVSDGVGCHPDLITVGRTGFLFTSGDAAGLAQAIRTFLALPGAVRGILAASAEEQVRAYSIEAAADGLAHAIQASVDRA
jgi:glycosyltransferase involved in cell wall biosynthesis